MYKNIILVCSEFPNFLLCSNYQSLYVYDRLLIETYPTYPQDILFLIKCKFY